MGELLIDFLHCREPGAWLLIGDPCWENPELPKHEWILVDPWPNSGLIGKTVRVSEPPGIGGRMRRTLRVGIVEAIERSEVTAQSSVGAIKPVPIERLIVRVLDLPVVDPSRTINYRQDGIDRSKRRRWWKR